MASPQILRRSRSGAVRVRSAAVFGLYGERKAFPDGGHVVGERVERDVKLSGKVRHWRARVVLEGGNDSLLPFLAPALYGEPTRRYCVC